ncbi:hypothetical protein BN1723_020774, partial [Verticillium longisporum]
RHVPGRAPGDAADDAGRRQDGQPAAGHVDAQLGGAQQAGPHPAAPGAADAVCAGRVQGQAGADPRGADGTVQALRGRRDRGAQERVRDAVRS